MKVLQALMYDKSGRGEQGLYLDPVLHEIIASVIDIGKTVELGNKFAISKDELIAIAKTYISKPTPKNWEVTSLANLIAGSDVAIYEVKLTSEIPIDRKIGQPLNEP